METTIAENRYGKYCVPLPPDPHVAATILRGEVYEEDTIKAIQDLYDGNGSIVHAGAYFGDFIPALASVLLTPPDRLHAVEPVPDFATCAERTAGLNKWEYRTFIYRCALGNVQHRHFLDLSDAQKVPLYEFVGKDGVEGGQHSLCAAKRGHRQTGQCVSVVGLDWLVACPEFPISIIHLDVEGYEIEALKGAEQTIIEYRPSLVLECWKRNDPSEHPWFKEYIIDRYGYRFRQKVDGNKVFEV